ncbi:hypothetical protein FOI68_14750 [Brevibacillus sp. LEMMJ03]|jgi:hypothetical protein|uniref:hypothetical protein n=1 Tax=Brevibacillus TaxID=55080 RepID=UPI000555D659|nr:MULTISPECIES: hypothetical protein [Brevibacillus]TRY24798.1 hypothetical protein FOI68_14750 [Brevibacillus sp. LEMMJ03]
MEIIDFSSEKNKHAIKKGVLRRLPDCYEYCFLPDYEMKYDSFQSQSIQMLEFFFTLLELKNKTLFVSVQFPLYYDTDRIREFLEYYTFSYDEKDEKGYYVKNALEIVEGKLFKGKPLVIGRRGRKKLYYDVSAFLEVTAHYNQYHQIVHTGQAEIVDMVAKKPVIFLNGRRMNAVPRIDFDPAKDFILSNGQFIVADYMDDYCGTIGFYRKTDPVIPVSYYLDSDAPVYIQLDEGADGSKMCVVEQKYNLDSLIKKERNRIRQAGEDEDSDVCDKDDILDREYPIPEQ